MKRGLLTSGFFASVCFAAQTSAWAGQAPGAASDPDIPVSHRDRVYSAEQFSNTVSVTDPVDNKLVGVIRLGDPQPGNFSPLYKGQVLVHGMGFSPDHRTIAVVSIGSNAVTLIDTATNAVKRTTYVGRSPHEAFFTPDGKEVWVTVRGEDYVAVLDGQSFEEKSRIKVPAGPGMQVWFTLKDVGRTMVFDAQPPFAVLKSIDTGPITNHVNFARTANGTFAYVTIGGLNEVKVFRTDDFAQVATVPVGKLPHGVWPSGDGSRIYVGLENSDGMAAIDTATNKLIATSPIGQAPQAITYVPNAVPEGDGTQGLQPLDVAGRATHLALGAVEGRKTVGRAGSVGSEDKAPTSVSLFDQGLIQVLQASVTGLEPKQPYVLGLAHERDGEGPLEPLAAFMTNPAGSAIVNATGAIRQVVHGEDRIQRRYLVIAQGHADKPGAVVQVQLK
jgi:YVTN family beta-propeller protein